MTASYFLERANFFAASGISKAPGTHAISISSSLTPCLFKASIAPDKSFDPINSLNLPTIIAYFFSC